MTLATKSPVMISKHNFETMLSFAKTIYKLKSNPEYIKKLGITLPETITINPDNPSVLMGYDFHLTEQGPKLIEINNNAGGLFEKDDGWIPQCTQCGMEGTLEHRVIQMFPEKWAHIAIVDEDITEQYMYPEMKAYAELFIAAGRKVSLVSPENLLLQYDGLYASELKVDAIYNRHTDFYLETEAMTHIRKAFMNHLVALNPYPRSYALIGDKSRMVDWWRKNILESLVDSQTLKLIRDVVPETHVLSEFDNEKAWATRKTWVFKPAARHGGKGVLLGPTISKKRFGALEADSTVMQKLVPPSKININDVSFKFDIRLYMHGSKLIGMAGRAWNGQITNFREEGSGWTAIQVEK